MSPKNFSKKETAQDQGTPGWLELYDFSLHPIMEARAPRGAYIEGSISTSGKFTPQSEIIGKAISKPAGMGQNSGWLELTTLKFHSDIEAVAPIPPYVHGEMDSEEHFYPDEPYKIISS